MLKIEIADTENIPTIVDIAYKTWFPTYKNVISQEQIDFMFGEMYTPEAIFKQMEFLKHTFLIIYSDDAALGFASFSEIIDLEPKTFKLHKLYLLPEAQGKNVGSQLIAEVEKLVNNANAEYLILNVNRNNSAYHFYLKKGYTVRETVDIPFAEFVLNDYVMEKKLN